MEQKRTEDVELRSRICSMVGGGDEVIGTVGGVRMLTSAQYRARMESYLEGMRLAAQREGALEGMEVLMSLQAQMGCEQATIEDFRRWVDGAVERFSREWGFKE